MTRLRDLSPLRYGLLLFGLSLAVRLLTAAAHPGPAYPDAFYYAAVAEQLAAGHGLTIPYLWAFPDVGGGVPVHAVLPLPSNAHWMPLASLIAAPFVALGGSGWALLLPFLLFGALLAPFTYGLARDLGRHDGRARLAGLLAVVPAGASPFLSQPDNYALYALCVGGALWLLGRLLRGDPGHRGRTAFGAGVLAGLAMLSRTDGFLLVGVVVLLAGASLVRRHRRGLGVGGLRLREAGLFLGPFILLVGPWFARQLATFGTFSVSSASGRILFIREYGEMFSANGPLGLDHLLSWGAGPLLASRAEGLGMAFALWALLIAAAALVPLVMAGALARRREVGLAPYAVWTVLFWLWSGIVAAPHLPTGNFLHSAVALVPLTYLLAADGYDRLIAAVGRRLPRWDAIAGRRRWLITVVVVVYLVGLPTILPTSHEWNQTERDYRAVATYLDSVATPGARVMSANPGAAWWYARRPGIQTPDSPPDVIDLALVRYDIRFVILERNSIVPAFARVLRGQDHPAFLSATPVFAVPDPDQTDGIPRIAVYAVTP